MSHELGSTTALEKNGVTDTQADKIVDWTPPSTTERDLQDFGGYDEPDPLSTMDAYQRGLFIERHAEVSSDTMDFGVSEANKKGRQVRILEPSEVYRNVNEKILGHVPAFQGEGGADDMYPSDYIGEDKLAMIVERLDNLPQLQGDDQAKADLRKALINEYVARKAQYHAKNILAAPKQNLDQEHIRQGWARRLARNVFSK